MSHRYRAIDNDFSQKDVVRRLEEFIPNYIRSLMSAEEYEALKATTDYDRLVKQLAAVAAHEARDTGALHRLDGVQSWRFLTGKGVDYGGGGQRAKWVEHLESIDVIRPEKPTRYLAKDENMRVLLDRMWATIREISGADARDEAYIRNNPPPTAATGPRG